MPRACPAARRNFADGVVKAMRFARRKRAIAAVGLLVGMICGDAPSGTIATAQDKKMLNPLPDPIRPLLKDLGDPDFATREAAGRALEAVGEPAVAALTNALRDPDPEVRRRAADALHRIETRTLFTLTGHTAFVNGVAFFPAGDKILTVGDLTYRIWDAKSGRHTTRGTQGSNGYDRGGPAAVAPDGNRIAVRYFVTDAARDTFGFGLEGHTGTITRIAYRPDGKHILSASEDGTLRLWRPDKEQELKRIDAHMGKPLPPLFGDDVPVDQPARFEQRGARDAAFSPDGTRIVSGGEDFTVRVWDAETGRELRRVTLDKVVVTAVAFLGDRRTVVSGGSDGVVRVWDAESGKELRQFTGHTGRVSAVAVTPDGTRVVSASHDKTARVWDAATGRLLRTYRGHGAVVHAVAVAPDGRTAVTGGADNAARVWAVPAK